MKLNRIAPHLGAVALITVFSVVGAGQADAQRARGMECSELWHARNAIYAEAGYCFKTERALSVFGPRCFPPYGRLSHFERERVEELEYWERRKGCRDDY
jgi:hypothetical protein